MPPCGKLTACIWAVYSQLFMLYSLLRYCLPFIFLVFWGSHCFISELLCSCCSSLYMSWRSTCGVLHFDVMFCQYKAYLLVRHAEHFPIQSLKVAGENCTWLIWLVRCIQLVPAPYLSCASTGFKCVIPLVFSSPTCLLSQCHFPA